MKAKYRKLGELVKLVDERNKSLVSIEVLGISIDKEFMPSVANTIGTDLSNYKLLKKNRFACNPMHVGRDERLPISLYNRDIPAIVSPAYFMFEVSDEKSVLPEYLMLNFKRADFDRNCWFRTDGSVRGGITWDDICEIEVPVPDIKEQQKIVNTYNVITNRIQIKQKINENLEKTAQCLFEEYFSEYNNFYDNTELKQLPTGWKYSIVGDYCKDNIKSLSSNTSFSEIQYLDTGSITDNSISELQMISTNDEIPSRAKRIVYDGDIVFSTVRPNLRHFGIIRKPPENMIVSTGFSVLHNSSDKVTNEFLYMWIKNAATLSYLQSIAENSVSTYPSINSDDLMSIRIIVPSEEILCELNSFFRKTFVTIDWNNREIARLQELKQLVISRISGM